MAAPPPPPPPSVREELREYLRRERIKAEIERLFGRFRLKKADRGEVVFIGKDGKRLDKNSRRSGIGIWVSSTGKTKRLLNRVCSRVRGPRGGKKRVCEVNWLRYRNLPFSFHLKGNRTALDKVLAKIKYPAARFTVKPVGRELTYDRLLRKIASETFRLHGILGDSQRLSIDILLTVEHENGQREFIKCPEYQFAMSPKAKYALEDLIKVLFKISWTAIGSSLSMRGLVSTGSYRNIREMNRRKFHLLVSDIEDWKSRRGQNWGKCFYGLVRIVKADCVVNSIEFGHERS